MDLNVILAAVAIIVAVLLWIYPPAPVRRLLKLETVEREPYTLPSVEMTDFRDDPVIGISIRQADQRGDTFSLSLPRQVPGKLRDGYEYFLTPDGRKCHYVGHYGQRIEELFLLVKQNNV